MKKIRITLLFLLIIIIMTTACNKEPTISLEENVTPIETETENTVDIMDEQVLEENTYEKIRKEYINTEGNRVTEYEDGYVTILSPENNITIVKNPLADDFTRFFDYKLDELPISDNGSFAHDLRSKDISNIDLTNELEYLLIADFDDHTKWPVNLPKEYDIDKIKQYGMDPGLGVRKLHEEGITGKGVGIAIIDQSLLVNHIEYKEQVKLYEEIHNDSSFAQMHGPAVASIAVGKNVGVAPGADLYYIAETHGVFKETGFEWDLYWVAKSIDRIIEVNKTLDMDKKIRVISISLGIDNKDLNNQKLVEEAIERARDEGIYTIHVSNSLFGVGRQALGDPNDLDSFTTGYFWRNYDKRHLKQRVLGPMDSRCIASPTGEDKYVFYYSGGMSWAVPYTAGLYALCCQVNPDIRPEEFNNAINSTATKIYLDNDSDEYKIVNPEALINSIKK